MRRLSGRTTDGGNEMSRKITYRDIPLGLGALVRGQRHTGSWSIFRPAVDAEKCTMCGTCVIYCPEASIEKTEDGIEIDYDYCKGCGICGNECPVTAIAMVREEE
jgi:pyruvate ferredoxin oxidoreductase delta subunit